MILIRDGMPVGGEAAQAGTGGGTKAKVKATPHGNAMLSELCLFVELCYFITVYHFVIMIFLHSCNHVRLFFVKKIVVICK